LLPVLLIAAAMGAMAGAAAAFAMTGAGQQVMVPEQSDPAVGELRARVEQLEAESRTPAPVVTAVPVQRAETAERQPAPADSDPALAQRLAALERAIGVLQQRADQRDASPAPASVVKQPDPVERERRVKDNQQVILDPRSDDKTKLTAWGQLRGLGDSWNDAVVATMTHLGLTSTDAKVRADVWRQADGGSRVHPVMCNALLQALGGDRDANVRDEAAETLENYLGQPGVREALELASRSDLDEKVRRRAVETLSRADRRR
jgi:hypothetical protein